MDRENNIKQQPHHNSPVLAIVSTVAILGLAFALANSPLFFSQKFLDNFNQGVKSTFFPQTDPIEPVIELPNLTDSNTTEEPILLEEQPALPLESELTVHTNNSNALPLIRPTVNKEAPPPALSKSVNKTPVETTKPAVQNTRTTISPTYVQVPAYWIQIKSFPTANGARDARDTLANLGFTAYIETMMGEDGKLYYHLRAGSWSNEQEAERFKRFITAVRGFESATVVKSMVSKRV